MSSCWLFGLKWKLLLLGPLGLMLQGIYVLCQFVHIGEATVLEPGWLDLQIPFNPHFSWLYISMYPLVILAGASLHSLPDIRRFAIITTGLFGVGALCFFLFPTIYPRPEIILHDPLYAAIVAIDQPRNVFPCLHSAFTTFGALTLMRAGNLLTRGLILVWAIGITYAIIAVRQHTVWDTFAGFLIGLIAGAFMCGWHGFRPNTSDKTRSA